MANIRIVTENGETISYRDLCMSKDVTLRPHRGEYIHTKDGQKRYEILSVEWCKLTEDDMCGVLMILRETPIEEGTLAAEIRKPIPLEKTTGSASAVPHFYLRYRCKNCGSKYGKYPEQCHSCGAVGCFEEIVPEYQSLI